MKNIFTFGRKPAQCIYIVACVIALKVSGRRLTICNPATLERQDVYRDDLAWVR